MINKNYLKYLFKSLYPLFIVCGVIGVITLGYFPFLSYNNEYAWSGYSISYIDQLQGYYIIMVLVAIAVPLTIHSRYYSKNSSDIYLSLPMNRKQAYITENIFGLIIVIASTLIGFLAGLALTGIANLSYYMVESYLEDLMALPIVLIAVVISYLMSNYAVSISNSMIEAIMMIIAIFGICLMLWGILEIFVFIHIKLPHYNLQLKCITFGPGIPGYLFSTFTEWSMTGNYKTGEYKMYGEMLLSLLINLAIWCGFSYLGYRRFLSLKSEHLGTASMELLAGPDGHAAFFGLIYIFVGSILYVWSLTDMLAIMALLTASIGYWVSLFVLRRRIAFRKDDLIRFAIAIVGGVIIGILFRQFLIENYPVVNSLQ